jgi:hypothetical protein
MIMNKDLIQRSIIECEIRSLEELEILRLLNKNFLRINYLKIGRRFLRKIDEKSL